MGELELNGRGFAVVYLKWREWVQKWRKVMQQVGIR